MTSGGDPAAVPGRLVVAVTELPSPGPDCGIAARQSVRYRQSSTARALACAAAARLSGCPPGEFQVGGGGDTRPSLAVAPRGAGDILISLTHSGRWVAAAAGRGLTGLGIDIQEIRPGPVDGLVRFMDWTAFLAAPVDPAHFTHLWTVWEAAVKCDGAALLAKATPTFSRLAPRWVPGRERSWSTDGQGAMTEQVAPGNWLTVVAKGNRRSLPRVEILRIPATAMPAQQA